MQIENLNIIGKSDKAIANIGEDNLFPDSYIDAFVYFIKKCETPMTISLQGAWGTGKTSLFNIIRKSKELNDICIFHTFDALLYSQFSMDENLSISLLKYICHEVDIDETYVNDCIKKILNIGFRTITKMNFDKAYDANEIFGVDGIDEIKELRYKFRDSVYKLLEKRNGDAKLVFFVDNLDRIKSEKAIEIIETLHTIFDSDKCVFILAIDYDVVVEGANKKYGNKKGKDFFDKMIQLPFNMPTEYYNIDKYFTGKIKSVFNDKYSIIEGKINEYLEILKLTIGTNPRAINRLINTFAITFIADYKGISDKNKYVAEVPELLFCLLSINMAYPKLYEYLLLEGKKIEKNSSNIDNYLKELNIEKFKQYFGLFKDESIDIIKIEKIILFYAELSKKVNEKLMGKQSYFYDILSRASVTGGNINI